MRLVSLVAAIYCIGLLAGVSDEHRFAPESAYPPAAVAGVVNADITQENVMTTVCVSGWTKTVRPPASFTNKLKKQQMAQWSIAGSPSDFEEDHRLPLEIGGNPVDPGNLWPQPWAGQYNAHMKDKLENAVHKDLCAGKLTLQQARAVFLGDFWAEYNSRFGKN